MATYKTIVEKEIPEVDEFGELIDTDGIPMNKPSKKEIRTPSVKRERFYLLHWGLEVTVYHDKEGNPIPVSHTVGICQHIKSGQLVTYMPGELKVTGKEKI